MTSKRPEPAELERMAVELALGAAQVVREGVVDVACRVDVSTKSSATDLVTDVDRRTEQWLVSEIARVRPDDSVLGEEGGAQRSSNDQRTPARARQDRTDHPVGVRWVLDPIDGTVNFVLGIPQYAVSVAAEVDGTVVAGAVCNPVTGETFRAHRGGGARLDDHQLTGPREVSLARAVVGTGFSYDASWRAAQIAVIAPMLPQVADIRRLGASSLDLCFVAAGRLDAYFEVGLNPWDHAAGGLIAAEAGCVLTGLRGNPPSGRMLAVAGPGLAGEFFALLEDLGADTVTDVSR